MSVGSVYVVDEGVVQVFSACTGREREELLRVFRHLALNPLQRGDFIQKTSSFRELQVKRFGKWLVTYWADQPVKEVKIVDIKKLVP